MLLLVWRFAVAKSSWPQRTHSKWSPALSGRRRAFGWQSDCVSIASSAIDISDGLAGDMRHVLRASAVGAAIEWARVPRSPVLQRQPMLLQQRCALTGGDDYELLFTAPSDRRAEVIAAAEATPVTRIGTVTATADLAVLDERGAPVDTGTGAYDHFGR